jgi:hypothetical protein
MFVLFGLIIVYATSKIWWITSLISFLLLMLLVIPPSYDLASTLADKALTLVIMLPFLLLMRFFSRLHQRRGIGILKDYWNRK